MKHKLQNAVVAYRMRAAKWLLVTMVLLLLLQVAAHACPFCSLWEGLYGWLLPRPWNIMDGGDCAIPG